MNRFGLGVLLLPACLGLLQGCSDLPDQGLAAAALQRGDTATAQKNFAQLANMGYPDAQTSLGDMQVRTRDPAQVHQAETLYREAAVSSVRAQTRLGRLLAREGMATEAQLKEAEKLLNGAIDQKDYSAVVPLTLLHVVYPRLSPKVDPQKQVNEWLALGIPEAQMAQILIWRADGSYAKHLDQIVQSCNTLLSTQDVCYLELATVYRMRNETTPLDNLLVQLRHAYTDRQVQPERVESVGLALSDPELPGPAELTQANEVLLELAPTYPQAWSSLAKLYADYPQMGSSVQMIEYLKKGLAAHDSRAELLAGRLYYDGQGVAQDPKIAEQYLQRAAKEQPSAHYYLGQIYRRGYFGKVEPQKALDHLLIAARSGQAAADYALAQLYSENRGVKVNLVDAYVFAALAQRQGVPEAPLLVQAIEPGLSASEHQEANGLIDQEQQSRLVGPARLARFQATEIAQGAL